MSIQISQPSEELAGEDFDMQNLTRTLALEYGGHGIRVNGVGPGATITPWSSE